MLEKYLVEIGLSEKEASVYVALLSFDRATIAEIAEKAKIKRPTAYVIIESLKAKGLASESVSGKKTFYLAETPEKLRLFIERQIHTLDEKKQSLDFIIPELKSIQREEGEKPVVQFFEGKEGVLSSNHELFLKKIENEKVYNIYSRDLLIENFNEQERKAMKDRRMAHNITSRTIYTSNGEAVSDNTGERLQIDIEKYPIKSDIAIYGDQVKIAVLGKKLFGISITSPEIAETLKSLINYILDQKK
jgi:HTH-type transcriptional regulator, sugar sensing transcriptional regulator